jgi:transmembrane sensor
MNMEEPDNILKIAMGHLAGEQKKSVLSQMEEDQSAQEEFKKAKNAWALISSTKEMPDYQLENLFLNFKKQLSTKRKFFWIGLMKYAAIFILAVGFTSLVFFKLPDLEKTTLHYTSVYADNGQISKVILPDSSVVWLNSGSKITYNNNFAIDNREITLTGQAFFNVTKNKEIPLNVFCNNLYIKVLGTKFDVSAYPTDKDISVVLESGKVEMFHSKINSFHYELKPGERARYNRLSEKVSLEKVKLDKFTLWKDGILIFKDDPMSEVISKLKRHFDVDIVVEKPEIYKSVFTATIKNETLEETFRAIGFSCSIQYKIIRGENLNTKTRVILTAKSD